MKTRLLAIALLLAATTLGCHRSEPLPEGVLSPQAYSDLLTDLYLAEGLLGVETNFTYKDLDSNMIVTYDSLLSQHQTTPEIFEATTNYYLQHRELFKQICDQVVENLNQDPTPQP